MGPALKICIFVAFYMVFTSAIGFSKREPVRRSLATDRFNPPGNFWIEDDQFMLDGEAFQVFAAELHYFRIHPGYWEDRLYRVARLGINTIQIYVPWNLHEPFPGEYNFDGLANLLGFIELVQDHGLFLSFRPGPYICAEWDLGGLPWWLLKPDPPIRLRTNDTRFMNPVKEWFDVLLPMVEPYLYTNGGPIIMVQIENEFGAYGNVSSNAGDRQYMEFLIDLVESHLGEDVILFTADWQYLTNMEAGSFNSSRVLTAGDFGHNDHESISWSAADQMNPPGMRVKFNPEFYTGWLTRWGEQAHNSSAKANGEALYNQLRNGGSVSMYLAHGGTNFGFWAGANGNDTFYHSVLTSYDYNAPLGESGRHTIGERGSNKYLLTRMYALKAAYRGRYNSMQRLIRCLKKEDILKTDKPYCEDEKWIADITEDIKKYDSELLPEPEATSYGRVEMKQSATLFSSLDQLTAGGKVIRNTHLQSMEQLGQGYGFILYGTTVTTNQYQSSLEITGIRDFAQVFIDGIFLASRVAPKNLTIDIDYASLTGNGGARTRSYRLDILVENMGHINFNSSVLFNRKGILGNVVFEGMAINDWDVFLLPMEIDDVESISYSDTGSCLDGNCRDGYQPTFFRGYFPVSTAIDTYVNTICWTKGVVWINGFNLGRYFFRGPQQTLYVPKFLLNEQSDNEIVLFEVYGPVADSSPAIILQDFPIHNILIRNEEHHKICGAQSLQ